MQIGDLVFGCPARNVQGGFTAGYVVAFKDLGTSPKDVYMVPVVKFNNGLTQPVVTERMNLLKGYFLVAE